MDVQATQSNSSAPVEVSWSPPADGANIITGYRIYYGNVSVQLKLSSSNDITHTFHLRVNTDYIGQTVSVRSEAADQLYSDLVSVSVSQSEPVA